MTMTMSLIIGIPLTLYALTGIILCILDDAVSLKFRRTILKIMVVAAPVVLLAIYLTQA